MTGSVRHGWAVFGAMALMFLVGAFVAEIAEQRGNPIHQKLGVAALSDGRRHRRQHGGQGGPLRHRRLRPLRHDHDRRLLRRDQLLHDSFTPIGGLVPLANIASGEIIFGGVGAGLYGMFLFIVLSVFIAGLMVGRTPEYLGKKIEAHEVKLAMLSVLILTLSHPGLLGRGLGAAGRALVARTTRARTASPRSSTPSRPAPATTARRSRA